MSKTSFKHSAPDRQPLDITCLHTNLTNQRLVLICVNQSEASIYLAKINDQLTISLIHILNGFTLSVSRIGNINPVLGVGLQIPSLGGNVDVDTETIAIIGELINDQSVFIKNVNLARHIMIGLDQVSDEGDLHLATSLRSRRQVNRRESQGNLDK